MLNPYPGNHLKSGIERHTRLKQSGRQVEPVNGEPPLVKPIEVEVPSPEAQTGPSGWPFRATPKALSRENHVRHWERKQLIVVQPLGDNSVPEKSLTLITHHGKNHG